jgi:hypothetical protein
MGEGQRGTGGKIVEEDHDYRLIAGLAKSFEMPPWVFEQTIHSWWDVLKYMKYLQWLEWKRADEV